MHNGFLQVEGEKMSKSLGNFVTIRELLNDSPGEAIRFAMLASHYRQPMNWTAQGVAEARRTLDHWYNLTKAAEPGPILCAEFLQALEDDLNTPRAIAALHDLAGEAARGAEGAARSLKASAGLLGVLAQPAEEWAAWRPADFGISEKAIRAHIEARLAARKARDWAEADRIRGELAEMGVALKDSKDPATGEIITTWEVARP
jgi:cysteinyl-tRNA synthetase